MSRQGSRRSRKSIDWSERWFCPRRLGRSQDGQIRMLRYQHAGGSGSGLQAIGSRAEGAWHAASNHFRPQTCVAEVDVDAED